jgi:hypothetical protein
MTERYFNLPPQCVNCSFLHRCIEKYFEATDELATNAVEAGMQAERQALRNDATLSERKGLDARTGMLVDAAEFVADSAKHALQAEMDIVGLYCSGTRNPKSPQLQDCESITSALGN